MGNCLVQVDRHDIRDIEVFNSIFLNKNDIASLFNVFNEVDVDGSGSISVAEFLVTQRLDPSPTLDMILGSFNIQKWNFLEFSCLLWNFLSIDESQLSSYMFFMFNSAKKNIVPFKNISKHYHHIHGGNFKGNVKLIGPLSAMEARCGDTGVLCEDFVHFCKDSPVIMLPLVMMHFNLRDKILGIKYWQSLSQKRFRHDAKHVMDPIYIFDQVAARRQEMNIMAAEVSKNNGRKASFARRMSVAIRGQHGKGGGKGSQSVRKKETRIGHAARRLSTTLLPGQRSHVESVVGSRDTVKKKKKSGKGKKDGVVVSRYGYKEGDPDDNRDDMGQRAHADAGAEIEDTQEENQDNSEDVNNDKKKKLKSSDLSQEKSSSKKISKSKSTQIHPQDDSLGVGLGTPDDDAAHGKDTLSDDLKETPGGSRTKSRTRKSEKKSKKGGKLTGAVRRMSASLNTSMTSLTKKSSKKKNRSQTYATGD